MQQPTGIAILAVQLAAVDRRALSQAWYSALHLARQAPPSRAAAPPAFPPDAASQSARAARPDAARTHRSVAASPAARASTGRSRPVAEAAERRAPKCELARRIERGLARGIPPRRAAAFDVRALDGRVHVVVRNDGRTTRVIAVCAPALRERVERALAQARFALAAGGARTEAA